MFTLVMQMLHSYYKAIIIKTKNMPDANKFILLVSSLNLVY